MNRRAETQSPVGAEKRARIAMNPLRLLFTLLLCAATSHAAPLTGRLAYIQNGAAYVVSLPNGKPAKLPQSGNTFLVSIAPTGGSVLYFNQLKADCRAYLSRPPYKTARRLDKPFDRFKPDFAQWTQSGAAVLLASWEESYLFRPTSGTSLRFPDSQAALSRDGKQVAFATEKAIKLRRIGDKSERVLFSVARPQPLFAALKRAKYPKNLHDLQSAISPDSWKDATMWNFGSLAFSADGKTLRFACNAGIGAGAAGNTTYCWFACDLKSGRLAALSKLGALYSRLPANVQLSPDGAKLLYVTSVHSSAIDNPSAVSVLDLRTQKEIALSKLTTAKKYDTNLVYGACWSPDNRAVAASALYYSTENVLKQENWQPRDADYTLYLRDLNNRTLRAIPGAVAPSWGR